MTNYDNSDYIERLFNALSGQSDWKKNLGFGYEWRQEMKSNDQTAGEDDEKMFSEQDIREALSNSYSIQDVEEYLFGEDDPYDPTDEYELTFTGRELETIAYLSYCLYETGEMNEAEVGSELYDFILNEFPEVIKASRKRFNYDK